MPIGLLILLLLCLWYELGIFCYKLILRHKYYTGILVLRTYVRTADGGRTTVAHHAHEISRMIMMLRLFAVFFVTNQYENGAQGKHGLAPPPKRIQPFKARGLLRRNFWKCPAACEYDFYPDRMISLLENHALAILCDSPLLDGLLQL